MPPLADRNAVEQVVAFVKRLTELLQVGVALQLDTELAANEAGAAIAADQIVRADFVDGTAALDARAHAAGVLLGAHELAAVTHVDRRHAVSHRLEQRLQRVLRNQLIGLER